MTHPYSCNSCRISFDSQIPTLTCPSCGSRQVSLLSSLESHVTWVTETFSGPPEALAAKIHDLIVSGATGSLSLNLKDGRIGTFEFRRRAPRPSRPLTIPVQESGIEPELELVERWDEVAVQA